MLKIIQIIYGISFLKVAFASTLHCLRAWCCEPLIPGLERRQRSVDLCEFKASLVCETSSRRARATQRPCLTHIPKNKKFNQNRI